MEVKFLELGRLNERYLEQFEPIALNAFKSGTYIGGELVRQFEADFAQYCGVNHCVTLANGLDALVLALRALDVGPGDEVIVPGQTFVATWLAVSAVGAKPVPVDVEKDTANIDASLIEQAITEATKAIIPVHLYGAPADMSKIMDIATRRSLYVVEDAAQAHGARHGQSRVGSLGHVACFSFYPSKNLGALGDAGAITTSDDKLAKRIRLLANYGSTEKYIHLETGVNSRMDPVQAAFLTLKLGHIDFITERRKEIAARYSEALVAKRSKGLTRLLKRDIDCVWHNFVVCAEDRDRFVKHMSDGGVGTAFHYPIIPSDQKCYSNEYRSAEVPNSAFLAQHAVSLPIGEYLSSAEVDSVVAAIDSF